VLCFVVKHAGGGRARKKCVGKHKTKSMVFPYFKSSAFSDKDINFGGSFRE